MEQLVGVLYHRYGGNQPSVHPLCRSLDYAYDWCNRIGFFVWERKKKSERRVNMVMTGCSLFVCMFWMPNLLLTLTVYYVVSIVNGNVIAEIFGCL